VLDDAFKRLLAKRVITGTAAVNHASRRLLERLGFQKISESIGSFSNTPEGKPIEFLGYTYAITRDEWDDTVTL
jgi:RimJ/RimL family protein N-acetyltransferase